jgi:hypothetical protein
MKKFFLVALLLCSNSLLFAGDDDRDKICLVSPKADTLFLVDDRLGREIAVIWSKSKRKQQPVIVFLPLQEMQRMALDPRYAWCEEKKEYISRYD